jgi:hypothetical protein
VGTNIERWTVQVLEEGLPPLPSQLEKGQTVPIALWRGERYGAVVFVRLWRNGQVDHDCAITSKAGDGSWEEPSSYGGSAWIDDPLRRPESGWDGEPVEWIGTTGIQEVRAVKGAASLEVAAIGVEQGGRNWQVPIDSPCGAFVIGIEDPAPVILRALGADGQPLRGEGASWPLPALDDEDLLADDAPDWDGSGAHDVLGVSEPEIGGPSG